MLSYGQVLIELRQMAECEGRDHIQCSSGLPGSAANPNAHPGVRQRAIATLARVARSAGNAALVERVQSQDSMVRNATGVIDGC